MTLILLPRQERISGGKLHIVKPEMLIISSDFVAAKVRKLADKKTAHTIARSKVEQTDIYNAARCSIIQAQWAYFSLKQYLMVTPRL